MLGQALDSKSSVTELCLADNELGLDVKGAMLSMRKAGSHVQGANGQCGETNMACIFRVFTFRDSNSEETNFLRRVRQERMLTLVFFSIPIRQRVLNPHRKTTPKTYRYIVDFH